LTAVGTLLGPEGTTVPALVSVPLVGVVVVSVRPGMAWSCIPCWESRFCPWWVGLCSWVAGVGLWVVGWLLVENCTVDASILFSVVKLSRANGGCLGTRSR
jgi:hypothetical protein